MRTTVLHLDIDAFFASVEQLRNPRLRGRPVLVGNGVIASCSYEARRFGCRAGMPLQEARRLCPDAVIRDGDHATYRCFTDALWEIMRDHVPLIETHLDEAYGDLTGMERIHAHPLDAGRLLKRRVREETGLSVTVGVASNRMIAKMAGKTAKPDGLAFVPWGEEERFLAPRPVDDLLGVGPVTTSMFHSMGIRTIADLRAVPLEVLAAMLGRNGTLLHERARGRDTRPVHEREIPATISRETALHAPAGDRPTVRGMLQYLLERGMAAVRALDLTAKTVRVRIQYEDGPRDEAGRTLHAPTDVDRDFMAVVDALLPVLWMRRVNLMRLGIVLSHFAPRDVQPELFDVRGTERLRKLHEAVDLIRRKHGHSAVVAGASIALLGTLRQAPTGYVLRTPSLTQ